jgi:hypothetical protein
MAKKEAHAQALKMFIESGGKTPLKGIAEAVGVSFFSVRRWCKTENWKEKIKELPAGEEQKRVEGVGIRRKDLLIQAVKIFNGSGGKISNAELGKKLGVTGTTIANWKKMSQWGKAVAVAVSPKTSEVAPPPEIAPAPEAAPPPEKAATDLELITSFQDLVALNDRLRGMLQRDFVTAEDIEHLSNAKLILLEAAHVYLGIVKGKDE